MSSIRSACSAGLVTLAAASATAQFPSIPRPPSLPSIPTPSLPSIPIPRPPGLPPIPRPPDLPGLPGLPPQLDPARLADLHRQATDAVNRFYQLGREADRLQQEYRRYEELVRGDSPQLRAEAYHRLRQAGVMGTNQAAVRASLTNGLAVVVWAKEFDHVEEYRLAAALGASAATGNPGPALAYLHQFAADSQAELLRSLKDAPDRARRAVEREFKRVLVDALDRARRGGGPVPLRVEGVDLTVGIATYNHWATVRYAAPELVRTQVILGVQLYEVRVHQREVRIPLPNTFQPYTRVAVRFGN